MQIDNFILQFFLFNHPSVYTEHFWFTSNIIVLVYCTPCILRLFRVTLYSKHKTFIWYRPNMHIRLSGFLLYLEIHFKSYDWTETFFRISIQMYCMWQELHTTENFNRPCEKTFRRSFIATNVQKFTDLNKTQLRLQCLTSKTCYSFKEYNKRWLHARETPFPH